MLYIYSIFHVYIYIYIPYIIIIKGGASEGGLLGPVARRTASTVISRRPGVFLPKPP